MIHNLRIKYKTVGHHFTGPAQYHHGAANNTVNIPGLKSIHVINDVRMWAPGLLVEPVAVLGNRIEYHVRGLVNMHAHDIAYKDAAGGDAVNVVGNEMGQASGGDITVAGAGANGGCKVETTPALVADAMSFVLPDDTNLSGIDIYVVAVGW